MADTIPQFSVIIPVFNKGPYVKRAIQSVLEQSHGNFEIIIVDDCSTDDSVDKIKSFTDCRIRLFCRDEPGPGGYAARNLGILEAKADWVTFLDADDEWLFHHLQTIQAHIDADTDIICCGYKTDLGDVIIPKENKKLGQLEALNALVQKNSVCTNSLAIRKEVIRSSGMFPAGKCKRGGDSDTWLRVLLIARHMVTIKKITSIYHMDASAVVADKNNIGDIHPVVDTVANYLQNSANVNTQKERVLKELSNRKAFLWATESKMANSLTHRQMKNFYFGVFSMQDIKRYFGLLLPSRTFRQLKRNPNQ